MITKGSLSYIVMRSDKPKNVVANTSKRKQKIDVSDSDVYSFECGGKRHLTTECP